MAGDQVPLMPFVEIVGKAGAEAPAHNPAGMAKVGVVLLVTLIFKLAVVAHWPGLGVNVYVPEAVLLIIAGDQEPEIPLLEIEGKAGAVLPLQNAGIAVNVGIVLLVTVTVMVTIEAH